MPRAAPSGRTRRWLLIAVAGLAALAAGAYVAWQARAPSSVVGQPATTLLGVALPDAQGREQRIDQWRGKVLVVNFWATWCAPCREEMKEFVAAQANDGPRGLQFVGIAIDEADKVQRFATEIDLNYPALIGGFGALELSKALGNDLMALPFTIVVGRDGRIAHRQLGPLAKSQLDSIVSRLL